MEPKNDETLNLIDAKSPVDSMILADQSEEMTVVDRVGSGVDSVPEGYEGEIDMRPRKPVNILVSNLTNQTGNVSPDPLNLNQKMVSMPDIEPSTD